MKVFTIALVLTAIVLIAGGLTYRRNINWSSASSDMAETETFKESANEGKRAPIIVELFTSEGCSSCPPADAVLAQLEKDQPVVGAEIIAMSEHVDYWNYIGWSDPFSSEAFSARQQAYAPIFGNDGVYTPQMVVDGQAEFIGSSTGKAQTAIARAAKLPKAEVKLVSPNTKQLAANQAIKFIVSVEKFPRISAGDTAEVLFAITESNLSSQVVRGENTGRKLAHTAVVRELRSLGRVDDPGKLFESTTSVMLKSDWKRRDLRAVVFVQERANKRILGAATLSLTEN